MNSKIFYITKEKLKQLRLEHQALLAKEKEKAIVEKAPKILESDDLSPEFVSFQEDVEMLRSRIDEVGNILDNHQLIKKPPKNQQEVVSVGATVLVDAKGRKNEFVIVGTLDANPAMGRISNESPVGRAFLGKKVGEEVNIDSPVNTTYKIKKIKYEIS